MKKQVYLQPAIKVLPFSSEGFICLSLPIGPGGGPGGGGDAKDGYFEDGEEDSIEPIEEKQWGDVSY